MRRDDLLTKLLRARRSAGAGEAVARAARAARAVRAAILRDPSRAELWLWLSRAAGHGSMRAAERRRSATAWAALAASSAGICLALWGLSSLTESVATARRASGWTVLPGVILASSVERCGDGTRFEPRIRYRFEVDGALRMGDRLALDRTDCGSERRAVGLAAMHPVDSRARVLYDGAGHGGSALEAGSESPAVWAGVGALAFFAAACAWSAAKSAAALAMLRRPRP